MEISVKRTVIVLSLIAIALFAIACSKGDPSPTPTQPPAATATAVPTSSPTPAPPTATPVANPPQAQEILGTSAKAMQALTAAHFDMAITMKVRSNDLTLDIPVSLVGDFQAPDRSKGLLKIAFAFLNVESQVISVGGTTYITNPTTGAWEVSPGASAVFSNPSEFFTADTSALTGLTLVGEETVGGVQTFHIRGKAISGTFGDASGSVDVDYWIGIQDGYVRKLEATGPINPGLELSHLLTGVNTTNASMVMRMTLSDFNKPVIIEAPIVAPPAPTPVAKQYPGAPATVIEPGKTYTATIELAKGGNIVIGLYSNLAPITVNNYVFLARDGYYNGVTFHRVIANFMAQSGDPTGTGTGSPGYTIPNEFSNELRHAQAGILSMANGGMPGGRPTNGSQFFITYGPTSWLDGLNPDGSPKSCSEPQVACHSVFGIVLEGMDVLRSIAPRDPAFATAPGDAIRSITIQEYAAGQGPDIPLPEAVKPAASDMADARYMHVAAALHDGRTLVVGGIGQSGPLSSTEIFDPATNRWTTTGGTSQPRAIHSGVTLKDGRVLVSGGLNAAATAYINLAEVFNPATGAWTVTGPMSEVRGGHSATLLGDGRVLIAGGSTGQATLKTAEIYDPATSVWTRVADMAHGRDGHSATLLANGKVLVAGGADETTSSLATTEVYDPATNSWSSAGNLAAARSSHTATLLPNGNVLVAGGGIDPVGVIGTTEIYDAVANKWTGGAGMSTPRAGHSAVALKDGKVMVMGGLDNTPAPIAAAEIYDSATGIWVPAMDMPSVRILHRTLLLSDGRVLSIGGVGVNSLLASIALYDPATGRWAEQ
ncbi:MAG: LppX_LprAFG lipoprotein [SAR202 cluster bacterium]|nr:LppX_LprAFG lipoprotein [SAR202 cluster bacterium]